MTYLTGDNSIPYGVAVGDFNNDGNLDIVVVNRNIYIIRVILGYGNGKFEDQLIISTGSTSGPNYVTVSDFNSDNQLDIAVANQNSNEVGIVLGLGEGSFSEHIGYLTNDDSAPQFIYVVDVNNDNKLDMVIANYGCNSFSVLYGLGDGTFERRDVYPLDYGYRPYSIVVTDLDRDNWLDIIIACYGTDHIETLMNKCE